MENITTALAEKAHVNCMPGVCGGKPCIVGTRIRVQDIYIWHEMRGQTADQIIAAFPQLTLSDVYAALAYFWDHRAEVLEQMKQEEEEVGKAKSLFPSKLRRRDEMRGDSNALSS